MASTAPKTALKIVMGSMTFGEAGKFGTRVHDLNDVAAILDVFQAHEHKEVDSAVLYGEGTTEQYLAKAGWQKRGLTVATKLYPVIPHGITHKPEDVRKYMDISLRNLQTDSIDIWYLHGPDRTTPYEVTLKALDELHKEGKFKKLGLSNYMAWEVAQIVEICKANQYIQPTVYQGLYNAIHRSVEPELFPCLRKYGLEFYAFNPLAGGFFTGKYRSINDAAEPGSRFDPGARQESSRKRYWNEPNFRALAAIEAVAKKHELTMAEIGLRWISHHSLLKGELGDAVLVGASSLKHIEQNLAALEKGPLPEDVVTALDEAWIMAKAYAAPYYH